jgi:hypothetical protein
MWKIGQKTWKTALARMTNVKGANDKGISNGQGQISRAVNLSELAQLKVTCGSVVAHH